MACGTTKQFYLQVSPKGLSKTTFVHGQALNKEHLFRKMQYRHAIKQGGKPAHLTVQLG